MGETIKKNHWIQSKVDNATKKINQEIYERNRQAPINIKLECSNLDNFNFADKKYLLHSLTSYNCMWQIRKLNIPPQEYFDYNFNFIESVSDIEK